MIQGLITVETPEQLVRLWAHEALRLFSDRLVTQSEKDFCNNLLKEISEQYFKGVDIQESLRPPLLFSSYLSQNYESYSIEDLKDFL